ncbi:DegT/DnrJ/EryC1/StrS family aminotransferase [Microvirga thermotolerans]|uniref:Aminotransferase class I/II-fold pyridoxal phosphate-dependent enzyme n=1 Tax=Microvirga thermotolerans TaxID=2651334 RepID=A0A5P9K1E8_9HYPH|nr:DegT/DnrJ/EryC1/StrS family aminotransferase [Microvirga thermotolerans]QFU17878.1 aminotransferase class I/II-fold pyridoxal phosphate-dependent enzyme [Microvirga thermotolerans]
MIPFLDLKAQYRTIQEPLERSVIEALRGCDYVLGEPVRQFEEAFAAYCGVREAVSLNSGTSALHLALLAAGVRPGDEVVTVPMTFVATVAAVLYAGGQPVLVDVDPDTFTMDVAALEAAITPRTRAIVPVHLHGRLANIEAICEVARHHGIPVIEDAAQAHGAERDSRRAGAFGTMGCFSFYPGKNLGACGEGGAVVTNDPEIASVLRSYRDWGQEGKYNHVRHGFNYRMDTLQAAALGVKLRFLPEWTSARQRIARLYDELLSGSGIRIPQPGGSEHVYHVYAVCVSDRDRVRARLAEAGIATGIHYPRPVHLQPAYAELVSGGPRFPVSEWLADHFLSLPMFPEMTDDQVAAVADALLQCVRHRHVEPA